MSSLSLKNVTKRYPNGFVAVKNFSLEVSDQEFVVFVGPSGCGKSTILRMIAGLEEITSGELGMDGILVNHIEPKNRNMSMIFQNYVLYPDMTVYENMAFALKMKKLHRDEIDRMVKETAGQLDLLDVLDKKPEALSDVQRQSAAIGRAVVRKPKIVLMDEPLANMDSKKRRQMQLEILKLHKKLGVTVIYVTKDQEEAMALGTKILVMKDSVIQQIGTPEDLYNRPVNKFVAEFIGRPQMKLLDGAVEKSNQEICLSFGENTMILPKEKGRNLEKAGYIGKEVMVGIRSGEGKSIHIFDKDTEHAVLNS